MGLYLFLAGWMVLRLPVFASPNESLHYEVVALLHMTGEWPDPAASVRADERHQPPLYYLLVGAVALPLQGLTTLATDLPGNPHFGSTHIGNLNPKVHANWQNIPLLYVGRMVSVLFGLLGIVGISLATSTFRTPVRLLAVALFAFHPMVLFIGASLSNDLPVAAMAALLLGYSTTLITQPRTWRAFIMWGVLLAAALLTKASAIFLILLLPFVCLAQWYHHRALRPVIYAFLAAVGAFLFLWSFWVFYNLQRDLDPLGVERSVRLAELLALRPRDLPLLVPYLVRFWRSFTLDWSVGGVGFGPPLLDWAVGIGVVTGLLGWSWNRARGLDRLLALMHAAWIVPVVIFYLASNLLVLRAHGMTVAEGRLLLLILPSLAWLTVGGWLGWSPTRWRDALAWGMLAAWALTATLLVGRYLPRLYPRMDASIATPDPSASPLLQYEDKLALSKFSIPERLTVGALTPVELTWEPLTVPPRDYTISVQLLQPTNPQWVKLDSQNSYPGLGMNPTSSWVVGMRYQDRFYVRPEGDLNGPTRAYAVVWVLDGAVDGDALTVTQEGKVQDPPIARTVVVDPATPLVVPANAQIVPVAFGSQIELIGLEQRQLDEGEVILITYWQGKDAISEDYSFFVHWLDTAGQVLAQSDGMPNQNLSPTTLWRPGDVVRDSHILPTPASAVQEIRLGVYRLVTLERLPAYQEGRRLVDDATTFKLQDVAFSHE